jgi:AcrR family transcriptional regulator
MSERESRAEKAAATRSRVIEEASTLFLAQGYAATTTREIAAKAEVTERTLFNLVANKSELLREVLMTFVFTQDYDPLLERRDFAATLRARDAEQFVAEFARWVAVLHRQTAPVAAMTRAAAAVDPGVAEIWAWGNKQQITDLLNLAKELRKRNWLRPDLSVAEAARSLAVLSGHETYWRLVREQGWSHQRYRRWLVRHCAAELR